MKVEKNIEVWSDNIGLFDRKLKGKKGEFYGDHWGLPENKGHLRVLIEKYLLPYVDKNQTALEIGSGGGRWTHYLSEFGKCIASDINPKMISLLKNRFKDNNNMEYVLSNGTDYPGVAPKSVDFVFSYGVFVHIDPLEIFYILKNIKPLLKPGAKLAIQFSDQNTEAAQKNEGFSRNNPDLMRAMVEYNGFKIIREHNFAHSSLFVFLPKKS